MTPAPRVWAITSTMVTVVASGGKQKVAVTVTDVDEPGKVTFSQRQAQVSRGLMARGPGDPDADEDDVTWQWSRGPEAGGPWTDIEGATSPSRSPIAADLGMYLRATVTYTDVHGAQEESGVAARVEARTLANAKPTFKDLDKKDDRGGDPGNPECEREREGRRRRADNGH